MCERALCEHKGKERGRGIVDDSWQDNYTLREKNTRPPFANANEIKR